MATGLTILNTAGTTQIDELYRNFCLAEKGTQTTSSGLATVFGHIGEVTFTGGVSPIIAIRSAAYSYPAYVTKSGSTYTWGIAIEGASGQSFSYYIFDAPPTGLATHGLRVFDASGNVVFDSGYNYMRVADFIALSGEAESGNRVFTSGREYAAIMTPPSLIFSTGYDAGWGDYVSGIGTSVLKFVDHTLYWSVAALAGGIPGYVEPSASYSNVLVVDVTNF